MASLPEIPQGSRDNLSRTTARIEDLPEELKGLLLQSLPDGSTLRALVHSSPSYHKSYLSQRQLILHKVLLNDILADCLILAYAVHQASKFPDMDYEDVRLARVFFLRSFFPSHPMPVIKDCIQHTDLDALISIFQRHWRIQAVASQYLSEKLSVNPVTREKALKYEPPSPDEIHRLYRTLYHFELFCFLFVSTRLSDDGPYYEQKVGLGGTEYGSSQKYLPSLSAWEAEEVACMREYFFNYYTRILHNCAEELDYLKRSPVQEFPVMKDPFLEDPASWEAPYEDQKKEYWMSLGLKFFQSVHHAHTAEAQAKILFKNPWRREHFLSKAVKGKCGWLGRVCSAHPVGFDHQSPEKVGSKVGAWCDIPDLGFINDGKDYLRSWGYVIWDRQRLDGWKLRENSIKYSFTLSTQ